MSAAGGGGGGGSPPDRLDDRVRRVEVSLEGHFREVSAQMERLFVHDEAQMGLLSEIRDRLTKLATRGEDHTGRIHLIEGKLENHSAFKAKAGGIYIGVAVTLATLASGIALAKSLLGK